MSGAIRARVALSTLALLAFAWACDENLPSGPTTFNASVKIVVAHDTLIVGDTSLASAEVTDTQGHVVQALSFKWTTSDANVVALGTPVATTTGDTSARSQLFIGRRPGRSTVVLTLPDPRFVTSGASRTETAVVAGVRVLTTHDSTLTAINDTAVAIATSLVKQNGATVNRASQGVRWTHLGTKTTVVGTGDTIRYISRSNGVDTLIATHDFCLAAAKCADTVLARVAQVLTLGLSARSFQAFSFSDTVGPSIVLADRRGNGLAGTSIRFNPKTAADAAIVAITPPVGTTNPVTGQMAAPKLVSTGNGTAKILVLGIAPDGFTAVAADSITVVVRQVARRLAVEPIRGTESATDSIPIRPVARDARGYPIADAQIDITATGIVITNNNGPWAGPTPLIATTGTGTIVPTLSGVALPSNNPGAPQIAVAVDPGVITLLPPDSVVAGTTSKTISFPVVDSVGQPPFGRWVRFGVTFGTVPDSAQLDGSGLVTVTWTPPDIAGSYTLTGVRGTVAPMLTLADSAGRIVLRKSLLVVADIPAANMSTAGISATTIAANANATITINLKDRFGNIAKNGKVADFTIAAGTGAISGTSCTLGVCTATYTAPAASGPDTITIQIGGANILNSPINVTIP